MPISMATIAICLVIVVVFHIEKVIPTLKIAAFLAISIVQAILLIFFIFALYCGIEEPFIAGKGIDEQMLCSSLITTWLMLSATISLHLAYFPEKKSFSRMIYYAFNSVIKIKSDLSRLSFARRLFAPVVLFLLGTLLALMFYLALIHQIIKS